MLKFEEFKNAVNGIQYDMENDMLYVSNGNVSAAIGNPFDKADTYEAGLELEERAEANEDVWWDLYNDYAAENTEAQIIVTTADKWIDGSGFETRGAILSREIIEDDLPITCDDIEPLDDDEFTMADNEDYKICIYIYNSEELEEAGIDYDQTGYWMKG